MATNTPGRQLGVLLPNVAGNLLTVPGAPTIRYIMAIMLIANTDSVDHKVTLYQTTGSSDVPARQFFPGATVPANSVVSIGRGLDLESGDQIDGFADLANVVNIAFHFIAVTP